ncbi:uncharacterized protein LOC100175430 isoform X2 [Ciona intestinalis]
MEENRSAETEEVAKKDTIDEIPILQNDELIQLKVIGSGGFGEVLLCCYRKHGNQMPAKYVVKKQLLRGGLRTRDYKYLQNEAKILWRLESPFVITMEGLSFSNNQFSIVVEYAENGSCADFFRRLFYDSESNDLVSELWPLKTRIAYQVINGMAYLHGVQPRRILHLDLKSQNVLLDKDLNVKLCDFGLSQMHTLTVLSRASTFTAKDGENNGGIRGTYSHIAPECFKNPNLKPTVKSDSYSFGIFVWELLTNKQPYQYAEPLAIIQAVCAGTRPDQRLIPRCAPKLMLQVMNQCYHVKPSDRPSFKDMMKLYIDEYETHWLPCVDTAVTKALFENRLQCSAATGETPGSSQIEISDTESLCNMQIANIMRSTTNERTSKWLQLESFSSGYTSEAKNSKETRLEFSPGNGTTYPKVLLDSDSGVSDVPTNNGSDELVNGQPNVKQSDGPQSERYSTERRNYKFTSIESLLRRQPAPASTGNAPHRNLGTVQEGHERCPIVRADTELDEDDRNNLLPLRVVPGRKSICCKLGKVAKIILIVTAVTIFLGAGALLVLLYTHNEGSNLMECPPIKVNKNSRSECQLSKFNLLKCTFSCDDGFLMSGRKETTCQRTGEWTNPAPFCLSKVVLNTPKKADLQIYCPLPNSSQVVSLHCDLPQLQNEAYRVGSTCSLVCSGGYKPVSSYVSSATCQASGKWSRPFGECKKYCPHDQVPSDLKMVTCTNQDFVRSACTYDCRNSKPIGRTQRTCLETGVWGGESFASCSCPHCYGGNFCRIKLGWNIAKAELYNRLTGDKQPVEVKYGDKIITCESDCDIIFINYDCTCKDSSIVRDFTCNDYLTRKQACAHALALLLRSLVAEGVYEAPCDLGESYSAC